MDSPKKRKRPNAVPSPLRRSDRVRKPPTVLDSSPGPSRRKPPDPPKRTPDDDENDEWRTRLRRRGGKRRSFAAEAGVERRRRKKKRRRTGGETRPELEEERDVSLEEESLEVREIRRVEEVKAELGDTEEAVEVSSSKKRKIKKKKMKKKSVKKSIGPLLVGNEEGEKFELEKDMEKNEDEKVASEDNVDVVLLDGVECGDEMVGDEECRSVSENGESRNGEDKGSLENDGRIETVGEVGKCGGGGEDRTLARNSAEENDVVLSRHLDVDDDNLQKLTDTHSCKVDSRAPEIDPVVEEITRNDATVSDVFDRPQTGERRRCGLCGRGPDGKPVKTPVHESADSDNEGYNGSSASEEPNYDVWDGFGDDPEWLGRLLGPIRDRFGITRIWVHQHCAVWSPEVYFAGLGCLKNVRAALCRGRSLKCCRCSRPGATIGCRVDRCPRTYHLPCARAKGCVFDHRKFLIACPDHRHLFQPQGSHYWHHIKKLKAKKLKWDMRKFSNEASRKDLEAEEKWLENCGEDEEFLKRESKRLHRDVLRIAPVYIGDSCGNKGLVQGWESVAGLEDVIQCMKEVVILPLLYPEVFSSLGITAPRGILLHGYPGTGKTMVVRSLIAECSRGNKKIAYFSRKGADCLGKYVGDAERQLRLLFQAAEKLQPSIIFFDEIDGLAPCRSRRQDQTHNSVVSTLLSLLDGLKSRGSVIVIGATNRPDSVDPALRRPGRFDREIYFPLPSEKDRTAILSLHTKTWQKPLCEPVLSWIAKRTVGYAGADLQALCTQAAIIALKRNCPLQELLSSAEKGLCADKLPSLPSFSVDEEDWLAALSCSPPPCSRREAGMAANDVASSPLQGHLLPCLLLPLSELLVSLYLDERIWLPPSLYKASKCVKNVIFSTMGQKGIPCGSWMAHLADMIVEPVIVQQLERGLLSSGLVVGPSWTECHTSNEVNDTGIEDSDSYRMRHDNCISYNFLRKLEGFRLFISGTSRSGQQHLANCLLHGFMGQVEIQKINLATISQEGNGDILLGVTQILTRCLSLRSCVLYLPRIELWSLDEAFQQEANDLCKETMIPGNGGGHNATKTTSRAWDSFVEQVDSACGSSLVILATAEIQSQDLPLGIKQFFGGGVSKTTNGSFSQQALSRFSTQINGELDHSLLFNMYSAKLAKDLAQQYIQNFYSKVHMHSVPHMKKTDLTIKDKSQAQGRLTKPTEAAETIIPPTKSERILSNSASSGRDNQIEDQEYGNWNLRQSPEPKVRIDGDVYAQQHFQKPFGPNFSPNKDVKGNVTLAIASFGYQILRFPHFAELCWATSKLKEGPCFDITASCKVWPFNSCIIRPIPPTSKDCKYAKGSGTVRGLVAVGLLAYKGAYTSVRAVSCEVRKVLELMVADINVKILGGRDRCHFLRILSQVAYLEDVINSWAYTFPSPQGDSLLLGSSMTPVNDKPGMNTTCEDTEQAKDDFLPDLAAIDCEIVQETAQKQPSSMLCTDNGDLKHRSSSLASEVEPKQLSCSATISPSSKQISSSALEEGFTSQHPMDLHQTRLEGQKPSEGLPVIGSSLPSETDFCNQDEGISSEDPSVPSTSHLVNPNSARGASNPCAAPDATVATTSTAVDESEKQINETEASLEHDGSTSINSETLVAFECCSQCLHFGHVLSQKILHDCWESNGRHSTIDDVHDVVASCSASLLAASSGWYASEGCMNIGKNIERNGNDTKQCSCQDIGDILQSKMIIAPTRQKTMEMECSDRVESTEVIVESDPCRLCSPALKFFFRNNTMVPRDTYSEFMFHCEAHKLCLRALVDMLLRYKQPLR